MDFDDIILDPGIFEKFNLPNTKKPNRLHDVSRANLFVGKNNSGKSRFLRNLYLSEKYNYAYKNKEVISNSNSMRTSLDELHKVLVELDISHIGSISTSEIKRYSGMFTGEFSDQSNIVTIKKLVKSIVESRDESFQTSYSTQRIYGWLNKLKEMSDKITKIIAIFEYITPVRKNPDRIYIPVLRGFRRLSQDSKDHYGNRTIEDYFDGNLPKSNTIFTGAILYEQLIEMLLGSRDKRNSIDRYQNFLSEAFFDGCTIEIVPHQELKTVVIRIGKEEERSIHELGDGIQSIILLTFLPFLLKDESFFFIEEPELFLHPGLQRKLMNFFTDQSKHRFFMTTHSNHLLDLTLDIGNISVYGFEKNISEESDEVNTTTTTYEKLSSGNENALELLDINNSSIFLVNSTIWVEGITDRLYFRHLLKSYIQCEKLDPIVEDLHYCFVEYGGSNITHWSFLEANEPPINVKRLCAKALVIVDKDAGKKEKRLDALKNNLGARLVILPCREVENLLPPSTIKHAISHFENKDFDSLGFTDNKLEWSSYKNPYLGKFIENKLLDNNFTRKGGYQTASGSIKDKPNFCRIARRNLDYADLSSEAKEVIQKIYSFIESAIK